MFNKQLFDSHFNKALVRLTRVEGMTKEIVKNMSREVLVALHETGDIGYINKLLAVLTPVNKRVFRMYAEEFTGFVYDETKKEFTRKNKNQYDDAKERALSALDDPHFNLWTWQEREVEMEKKPYDLSKITVFMKGALKKANKEGFTQADVIKAVFDAGVDIDALIEVMQSMEGVDLQVNEE
jgi:hypothetical protein